MADNVAITAGSGTTIAADDVGAGVLVQRVKATWGPDGTANDADVATGKPLPVQLRGSDGTDRSNLLPVSMSALPTQGYDVAVSLTRTNDTNAYAANDILGSATGSTAALTFASMGPSAGSITITSAQLEIDASAVISGETSYRLHLYSVTPPSALGDNAAWDLPSGDRASYLGYVDLGAPVDLGSTLYVENNLIGKQIKLAGTSLFAYLVTIGGYTPTASRVHVITLHAVAN